jgi:A/G-specific adenine glycosylase
MDDTKFRKIILSYWKKHGRHDLPWRVTDDPYAILISEVMLQQTQVPRVIPKFREFLVAFPTFRALANAPVAKVLRLWQGLGYNRRALMLQRCAQAVVRDHAGTLPNGYETLVELPGIGPYTAGAVMAFAFNEPWPVVETNIRRVILHHFFPGQHAVPDAKVRRVVERTLDRRNPRRWYAAMMDYGTHLAETIPNPNWRSRQYTKQSKFEGSLRQVRGRVLRALLEHGPLTPTRLAAVAKDARFDVVVTGLEREGFVHKLRGKWHILGEDVRNP